MRYKHFKDIEQLDEARMSPSVFNRAVEEGGDLGVLVGFEFEVCVPTQKIDEFEARMSSAPPQTRTVNWGSATVKGFLQALERQGELAVVDRFNTYFTAKEDIPGTEPATKKIMQAYKQLESANNFKKIIDNSIEKSFTYLATWNTGNSGQYDLAQQIQSLDHWRQLVFDELKENSVIGDLGDPEQLKSFVQREGWYDTISRMLDEIERGYRRSYNDIPEEDQNTPEAKTILAKKVFFSKFENDIMPALRGMFRFNDAVSRDRFANWTRRTFGTISMAQLTTDKWDLNQGQIAAINNILGGHSPDYDPNRSGGYRSNYRRGAEFIKYLIEPAFGKTNIFTGYHQATKNLTDYYIEPDGSINPDPGDTSAEVVTPPLPAPRAMEVLKQFYTIAKENGFYTGKQHKTGLHINVSIPRTLDILKLALFVGDEHILNKFKRIDNIYSRSVIQNLRDTGQGRDWSNTPNPMKKLKEIMTDYSRNHVASVSSENSKYISFRHAGGDYLNQPEDIINVVGRFVRSMIIASDPTAYKQEYITKAMRFAQPKQKKAPDLRKWIQTIRQGVPAMTIQMYQMSDTPVSDADLKQVAGRQVGTNDVGVVNVIRGEERIRENLLASSGWSNSTREAIRAADPDRFIEFTIIPDSPSAMEKFGRNYNYNEAYGMYLGGSRVGAGVNVKKDTLDKDSPGYRDLLSRVVRRASDQLIRDREQSRQQAAQRAAELQPERPTGPERREMQLIDVNGGSTTLMISADFAEDAARVVTDMLNRATPDVQRQWRSRTPLRLQFDRNTVVPINWPVQVSTSSRPPERALYTVRDVRNGDILMTAAGPRRWEAVQEIARENAAARNVPLDAVRITDLDNHGVYFIDGTPVTAETMAQRDQQSSASNTGGSGPWVIIDTNQPADASGAVVAVITDPMTPRIAADTLYERSVNIYPGNPELASRLRIINASSGQVLTRINQEDDYIDQAYIDRARRTGRGQQSAPQSTTLQGAANGEWIVYRREDGQDRMVYRTNGTRSYDYVRDRVLRDADTRDIPPGEFVFYNESSGLRYDAGGELLPSRQTLGLWRVYTRMVPSGVRELWRYDSPDGCEFGYAQERFENADANVRDRLVFYNADTDRAYDYNGFPVTDVEIPDSSPGTEQSRGGPFRAPHSSIFQIVNNRNGEILLPGRDLAWLMARARGIGIAMDQNIPREDIRIIDMTNNRAYNLEGAPADAGANVPTPAEQPSQSTAPARTRPITWQIVDFDDDAEPIERVTGSLDDAAQVAMDYVRQGINAAVYNPTNGEHYSPRDLSRMDESREYGDPAPIYYFAYGMLTDPRLMRGVDLVGAAQLPNFTLEFNGYANVVPTAGGRVLGVLWALDREILSQLDITEGYPKLYDRKTVPVMCKGKRYEAMVYTMTPETVERLSGRAPTRSYIKSIVNGYNNVGIPLTQISRALD